MLSTYEGPDTFGQSLIDGDRAALPLLGFVLGMSLSMVAWGLIGSIVWLVLN